MIANFMKVHKSKVAAPSCEVWAIFRRRWNQRARDGKVGNFYINNTTTPVNWPLVIIRLWLIVLPRGQSRCRLSRANFVLTAAWCTKSLFPLWLTIKETLAKQKYVRWCWKKWRRALVSAWAPQTKKRSHRSKFEAYIWRWLQLDDTTLVEFGFYTPLSPGLRDNAVQSDIASDPVVPP